MYSYHKTKNPIILEKPLLETIVNYIDKGYEVIYIEKVCGVTNIRVADLSGYTISSIKTILAAIDNYSDGFIVVFESEKAEVEEDDD